MILVTGATGNFGNLAIQFLLEKGIAANQISALVRNAEKAQDLKAKGINIITGNYDECATLVAAFKGVEKVLFVSSSDLHNRLRQHENIVIAAKATGVKHIVYTSFQRKNETETSPLWQDVAHSHLQTEKWLKESGITYTILKNNLYMEVIPMFIGDKVLETGAIFFPAGDGKVSYALRSEMAEAAAIVVSSDGHENKAYDINNIEAYSYADVAKHIKETTGKGVNYISPNVEEFKTALENAGVPAPHIAAAMGFALAQAQGDLDITGNDLENLIGRKPATLKDFIAGAYKS